MSAVAGSPELLDELAAGLHRQATGFGEPAVTLRRALDATPTASSAGSTALLAVSDASRGMTELTQGFDDLARFVAQVAGALRAADTTLDLAGAAPGSVSGPWQRVGDASGSGQWRGYARGARRTISGTVDDPFRPGRRTTTVRDDGSVQTGFTDLQLGVSVWSATRTSAAGVRAGRRLGGNVAHVDLAASAGHQAWVTASSSFAGGQAQVAVRAAAMAGGAASAGARVGNEYVGLEAGVAAFAGARAEAETTLGIGRDGLDAEVSARAFAGGEVEATGAVDVLGVRGSARAGVSYGAGVEVNADVEVGLDEVAFKLDLGATIGLGVSFGVDVKVSPRDVGAKGAKAAKSVWRAVT
jgi:hypothetical protein